MASTDEKFMRDMEKAIAKGAKKRSSLKGGRRVGGGSVASTVTVSSGKGGKPMPKPEKRVIQEEVDIPPGYHLAMMKAYVPVKLSYNYQSVGIEIGAEIPYPVRIGNEDDIREGMEKVYAIVEEVLVEKAAGLKALLQSLAGLRAPA